MRIHSIFRSVDGEVNQWGQGTLTTFVRLQGCNLDCSYCDTKKSQNPNSGVEISIPELIEKVEKTGVGKHKLTITGGEPYLQKKELAEFFDQFFERNPFVEISIETNGTFKPCWYSVCHIIDYKLPSSGMEKYMYLDHYKDLLEKDFVKFVIMNKSDFIAACAVMKDLKNDVRIKCRARFAFSPVHGRLDPGTLMSWMFDNKVYDAVLNVQLHKLLDLE